MFKNITNLLLIIFLSFTNILYADEFDITFTGVELDGLFTRENLLRYKTLTAFNPKKCGRFGVRLIGTKGVLDLAPSPFLALPKLHETATIDKVLAIIDEAFRDIGMLHMVKLGEFLELQNLPLIPECANNVIITLSNEE